MVPSSRVGGGEKQDKRAPVVRIQPLAGLLAKSGTGVRYRFLGLLSRVERYPHPVGRRACGFDSSEICYSIATEGARICYFTQKSSSKCDTMVNRLSSVNNTPSETDYSHLLTS